MFLKSLFHFKAKSFSMLHKFATTCKGLVKPPADEPVKDPDPVEPVDQVTSVPAETDQAVLVYDQAGDGEPDTWVRLSVDEVEDPEDLDSYIAAADSRLDERGIEADLLKVIFENGNGEVVKVLYRTEDGEWSETAPDRSEDDLIQPVSDDELGEMIAEADAGAEEPEPELA